MLQHSEGNNARLLEVFPKGFALDATDRPHVATGIAPRDYRDQLLAEPFESFTFSPAGAAVYELGQFGTAAKKLHEWGLKR
jgi:hypothetical protein